uniref:Uncharacterized protein n=1 Tax=Bracon brevicornis TaxID=1563983 RepID=A0A6V7HWZ8_9HYME
MVYKGAGIAHTAELNLINVIDQHLAIQDAKPPWGHVIVSATLPSVQICRRVDSGRSKFQGSIREKIKKNMINLI